MQHKIHPLYKGSHLALLCKFQKIDGEMSLVRRKANELAACDDLTAGEKSWLKAMQADLAAYNAEFEG